MRALGRVLSLAALLAWLTACSSQSSCGHFEGDYLLKPYSEASSGVAPKGEYVFEPDAKRPLHFVAADGTIVQPQAMWTDCGSVPPPLCWLPSFGSRHYEQAYLVHDWLMTEHRMRSLPRDDKLPPRVQILFDQALCAEAKAKHFRFEGLSRSLISHFANHGPGPRHHWNGSQPDPLRKWKPRLPNPSES
jgi:Protein of unknown function (DUF1353)